MKKTVYLRTFGCQMNMRDSEVIVGILRQEGFEIVETPEEAGVIILNTCSVREHAENRVWSEIGRYRSGKIIGLVGCMAKNYADTAFERAPNLNFVVGPQDIHKIPQILKDLTGSAAVEGSQKFFEKKIWETDGYSRPEEIYHSGFHLDQEHAFVVISEGCSNFCSYCVVPYVRGPLRHRQAADIVREVEEAMGKGIKRITLLGQNVNAYLCPQTNSDFIQLLKMVNAIPRLEEFSFVTSHPKDAGAGLFEAMRDLTKLKKSLHLPVQSGSNRILQLMNRHYSREDYLKLAKQYRTLVPGGVLSSDIIIGFPGETLEDFQATISLMEEVRFEAAYIFKYSPRPHTEAAKLVDDVSREEKERRHALALALQKRHSRDRMKP